MPTGEVHYKLETTLSHHGGPITVLQFSLGGEYLASGSDNSVILVYSTSSWKLIRRFVDASLVSVTGGKGSITQWVHAEYMEGSETICPTFTQWVRGGYFLKVPTKVPTR